MMVKKKRKDITVAIRMPKKTRSKLDYITKKEKTTKSDFLREYIESRFALYLIPIRAEIVANAERREFSIIEVNRNPITGEFEEKTLEIGGSEMAYISGENIPLSELKKMNELQFKEFIEKISSKRGLKIRWV